MRPLDVLVIMGAVAQGGAEWQLHELLRRLDRSRFRPAVASVEFRHYRNLRIGEGDRAIREAFESLGIPHYKIVGHAARSPRNVRDLYALLRTQRFDLVHTNLFAGETHGRVAAAAAGVPMVTQKRSMPFLSRRPQNVLADWMLNLATRRIILPSEAVRAELQRYEPLLGDRVSVIYAGVDPDRWQPAAHNEKSRLRAELGVEGAMVLTSVGRLMSIKGQALAIAALPQILKAHPTAVLLLVGHGVKEDAYRALAAQLGVTHRVRFVGSRSDVRNILSLTDVFVFPSLQESFGVAVVEAALMGVPAVASRVGGVPEIVEDGRTGLLVPPRQPDAIAQSVNRLLEHPGLRLAMGRAARARAARLFHIDRTVRATEEEYLRAVGLPC